MINNIENIYVHITQVWYKEWLTRRNTTPHLYKLVQQYLSRVDQRIDNLEKDLCDGLKLFDLVQAVSGKKISGIQRKPIFRVLQLENVSIVLTFLESEGVDLINIGRWRFNFVRRIIDYKHHCPYNHFGRCYHHTYMIKIDFNDFNECVLFMLYVWLLLFAFVNDIIFFLWK